jgi:acetoacetyl-CoA synthetase
MQTTIAMLAATSIGAVWSSCSPDFGLKGVLDRFGQTQPKVLFCANGYFYNGKAFDSIERVAGMLKEIPSIEKVVVIPYTEQKADISAIPNAVHFDDFLAKEKGLEIQFEQLPADHPLYIMYTSGTTGLPKCMVQSAAGILVNQMKEMVLHTDVSRDDTIFYFTTTGWMMWNWLLSGLTAGATLVLFDGSPFYPDATVLWKLAEEEGITVFGTSARYIAEVENRDVKPGKEFDLSSMKGLLSTGSPLSPQSYEFIYRDIKQDLCLSSISGGTDINGCFFVGNPILPVYVGELQCRGLGMKVEAYDDDGNSVKNQKGELVCTAPAPSMPIYFWNDPTQEKYHAAYYDVYPNIWAHGDYIEITDTGIVVYGRSDTTLNPQGVRIGTAEIYRQVETFEEIADSVVIGQDWDNDVRVVLFVRMAEGKVLDEDLEKRVKTAIRQNASPRHVPAKILPVIDIPYTISGKKVEKAVRNKVHGEPVPNVDALANPDSLKYYEDLEALKS